MLLFLPPMVAGRIKKKPPREGRLGREEGIAAPGERRGGGGPARL